MKIRNDYNNGFGVTYYVHSVKKVFEELPEGFDIGKGKKNVNKGTQGRRYSDSYGHKGKCGI